MGGVTVNDSENITVAMGPRIHQGHLPVAVEQFKSSDSDTQYGVEKTENHPRHESEADIKEQTSAVVTASDVDKELVREIFCEIVALSSDDIDSAIMQSATKVEVTETPSTSHDRLEPDDDDVYEDDFD